MVEEHWGCPLEGAVSFCLADSPSVDAVWRVAHNQPRLLYRESVRSVTPAPSCEFNRPMDSDDRVTRRYGKPWARIAAGICDVALVASLDIVVVLLTLRLAGVDRSAIDLLPAAPLLAFLLLLKAGYVVVLTVVGGQTFGKMAFGLRVVNCRGCRVSTGAAVARGVYALISLGLLPFGVLWMFVDGERCAWHDRLSGTRVVMC